MTQRGGQSQNQLVSDNFTDIIDEKKKILQHRCNHCEYQSAKISSRE